MTLHFTAFNIVVLGKDWPLMFGFSHLNPMEDVSVDFFFLKIERFERGKKERKIGRKMGASPRKSS